jgi:hypothetical protein
MFGETIDSNYVIAVDVNLLNGIPDAYTYLGEFVLTIRAYNGIYSDFTVTFASARNLDSSLDGKLIDTPVAGHTTIESMKILKVSGKKRGNSEGSVKSAADVGSEAVRLERLRRRREARKEAKRKEEDARKEAEHKEEEARKEAERKEEEARKEAERKKEEARKEAEHKEEERLKLRTAEAILESKIDAEAKRLTTAISDLKARRKALGFFGNRAEKKELDAQIAANETQLYVLNVLTGEKEALLGKPEIIAVYNWQCIAVDEQNKRALFITKNIIATMPYHSESVDVVWADCTLRKWLETDIYNHMPTGIINIIAATKLINANNPEYGTNGGSDTTDKIFLLSIDEVNKYFSSDEERISYAHGSAYYWWLRSPGALGNAAVLVHPDGSVNAIGNYVNSAYCGVRPALWLNLES